MGLIYSLLARHKDCLSPATQLVVAEHVRRQTTREAFAYPDDMSELDAQTGYLLFEREFSPAPVALFAQDVASLAHTRVRVFRARRDETGAYAPAEEVFSARMSEKSLTEAILLSNRGQGSPLTVTRLGDFEVPDHQGGDARAERTADAQRKRHEAQLGLAISELRGQLADQPTRASAAMKDSVSTIGFKIRDAASAKYTLERHLEAMTTARSEVLTEAAHAALHAQKIAAALAAGAPALPAPAPINWDEAAAEHPMVDAILDPLSSDLRKGLRCLIVAEIRSLAQHSPGLLEWLEESDGETVVTFPQARDRSVAIGWGKDAKAVRAQVDRLASVWNWALNPHLECSRAQRRATQASLAVTQRSGWLGNMHSTLPPSEGAYFSLSFQAAWEENDFGAIRVRSAHERLLEIEIVAEDLMTALRGHPDGLPVPCSIRALCGIWRQPVERPLHAVNADIAAIADTISATDEVKDLRAAFSQLEELVEAKRSGKAWREEVEAALEKVEAAAAHAGVAIEDGLAAGRAKIDEHVVQSAQAILVSMHRALPREVVDLLRLTRSDQ